MKARSCLSLLLLSFSCCLLGNACRAEEKPTQEKRNQEKPGEEKILGAWEVSDVLCSGCEGRTPSEKGTIINFEKNRIANPLYESCAAKAGYDFIRETPAGKVIAERGQDWPEPVKSKLVAGGNILYGFATCDGMNFMQLAFLPDNTAFYFYEGGIVLQMQRH